MRSGLGGGDLWLFTGSRINRLFRGNLVETDGQIGVGCGDLPRCGKKLVQAYLSGCSECSVVATYGRARAGKPWVGKGGTGRVSSSKQVRWSAGLFRAACGANSPNHE